MKHLLFSTILVLAMLASAGPVTVTYSSYLTDAAHKPRALTGQLVYFKLYTDSTSTTPIWEEQHGVIAPNGFISVALGSISPLPLRQIGSVSSLWLEMKIITDPPFPRQKIATSFFSISANYADSARHAAIADSAKKAAHAAQAALADRAIISDTAEYARGGSAVVSAQKADSAGKAGFAVQASLASRATISDTAEYARGAQRADSAIKAGIAFSARNADSLGGVAAGRYVEADTGGYVLIAGSSASARFNRNDPIWGPSVGLYRQNGQKWLLHGGWNGTDRFSLIDSSATERFTVLQSGNVGLGSTSPHYPLTLMRDGIQLGSSDARTITKMVNGSDSKGLYFGYDTAGTYGGLIAPVSGPLAFWTYSGSEWKERVRIAENGNVGIGTTAPAGKLEVNGNIKGASFYTDRNEGSLSGGDSTRVVISGLDDHTAYLVTASMNGSYCAICVSGIVTTTDANSVAQAVELSSVDYQTGSVRIRRFEDRAAASYSAGNGNKIEIELSARDVAGTAYWFWTITQISSKNN